MWRFKSGISKLMQLIVALTVFIIIVAAIMLFFQPELPDVEFTPKTEMPANLHFIMETTTINPPQEGVIYKMKIKEYNDSDAKGLAKKYELDDSISYNSDKNEWLAYENGEMLIINGDNGTWLYRNLTASQNKYNANMVIPSDEDAINLAKEYLTKLAIDTTNLNVPTIGVTVKDEKILQKSVLFYQDVEGYEMLGTPQLIIDIGHNGELEGIINNYYEFEKYDIFDVKPIEQVITELQSQQAQYSGPEIVLSEGVIYDIKLAYCQSLDVNSQDHYLMPVFLFSGEVETETGPTSFRAWVPAVRGLTISN